MRRILSCLKAIHFIPPALALALVCVWNISQMRSLGALEKDASVLREKIAKVTSSGGPLVDMSGNGRPASGSSGKASSDWKEITSRLLSTRDVGEKTRLRATMEFQKRLAEMSRDELVAALDELAGMDLSADDRSSIEEMILEALIKQDPQFALERFADRIESDPDGFGWQLSSAMREWAKKDLSAATAWFNSQIAAGRFESRTLDGRSEARTQFESALLESLMVSDSASAGGRLEALPEDQRREVLQQIEFDGLSPQEQQAYADLVRNLIPADERAGSFAHIAAQLVDENGYDKVGQFLDSVKASPSEREAAAMQTAESRLTMLGTDADVAQGDVDSLRTWLQEQAPGQVDSITGKALAEAAQDGGKFGFDQASQLIQHYQRRTGSDEVLVSFLKTYSARSNLEEARQLVDMVSDPEVRAQLLKDL